MMRGSNFYRHALSIHQRCGFAGWCILVVSACSPDAASQPKPPLTISSDAIDTAFYRNPRQAGWTYAGRALRVVGVVQSDLEPTTVGDTGVAVQLDGFADREVEAELADPFNTATLVKRRRVALSCTGAMQNEAGVVVLACRP